MELGNVGLHRYAFRWNAFQLQGTGRRQENAHVVKRIGQGGLMLAITEGLEVHHHGDWASTVAIERIDYQIDYQCRRHGHTWQKSRGAGLNTFVRGNERVRLVPCDAVTLPPATTLIAGHMDAAKILTIAAFGDIRAWHGAVGILQRLLFPIGDGSYLSSTLGDGGPCDMKRANVVATQDDPRVLPAECIDTVPVDDLAGTVRPPLDQAIESLIAVIGGAIDPNQDNATVVTLEVVEVPAR